MPGERAGLGGDPLHEVAVADETERAVVDDLVAGPVEAMGARQRSAIAMPTAFAVPWPSGPVVASTPGRQVELGMPGRPAAPLAERLEVVERQVVARQVQQAVEQHAAVAGREHEAVPVGPVRVARVVLEVALPQHVGHRRGPSGSPGWPELAFWTASIERVRIVSIESSSRDFCAVLNRASSADLITRLREGREKPARPSCGASRMLVIENRAERPPATSREDRRVRRRRSQLPASPWSGPPRISEGRGLALEWLEADGLGGFACGTAAGPRTRRYHGWYVPAIPPPRRRWMLVSGCEEFATVRGRTTSLSTQIYRDAMSGDGTENPSRFRLEPFPTWLHETGELSIERSLCVVRDRSMTVVRWTNRGAVGDHLRVRPLLAFRGAHRLQREIDRLGCDDRGPGRDVLGQAAALPSAPVSARRLRDDTRRIPRGTGTSGTPRKPRAATTAKRTSGARSSGSGRSGPTPRPSPSSRSKKSPATPTTSSTTSAGGAASSRRPGTRSSTSSRAAPRRSSRRIAGASDDPGRLPVALGLGPAGDGRGARASPSRTAALRRGSRRSSTPSRRSVATD